jgi:hypothetical protein
MDAGAGASVRPEIAPHAAPDMASTAPVALAAIQKTFFIASPHPCAEAASFVSRRAAPENAPKR